MATRQQGVFRKYAKPEVMAADWDELLLRVGGLGGLGCCRRRRAGQCAGGSGTRHLRRRAARGGMWPATGALAGLLARPLLACTCCHAWGEGTCWRCLERALLLPPTPPSSSLLQRMTQAFSKKPAEEWQPHAQLEEVAAVAFQEEEEQRLQDVDRQREEDREQEEEEEDEREERAGKPEEGKEGAKQEQAEEQEGQRQQAEAGDEQEEQEEQAAAAKKVKKEEQGKGKDTATERR